MHFQKQYPQGKLVRVTGGRVFDVAVDLRKESKTYGKWFGVELTEENKKQFDFVLIDCPPEFNIAVLNAIEASDRILIPTTDSAASRKGAACVIEELQDGDYDVRVTVLPVMWPGVRRRQRREAKDIAREITALGKELGCELAPAAISWTPKAGEADRADKLLGLFSPKCAASMAYRWLARWLVEGR